MKVINLFAGPGSGKSTTAAYLFARLKMMGGINVELAHEVAKEYVYQGRRLDNQIELLALQYARLKNLERSGCELAVSDSPLMQTLVYARLLNLPYFETYKNLVLAMHNEFDNWNFYIERVKPYSTFGREQAEEDAKVIDRATRGLEIVYDGVVSGSDTGAEALFAWVKVLLGR